MLAYEAVRHAVIMLIRAKVNVAILDYPGLELLFELVTQDRQRCECLALDLFKL